MSGQYQRCTIDTPNAVAVLEAMVSLFGIPLGLLMLHLVLDLRISNLKGVYDDTTLPRIASSAVSPSALGIVSGQGATAVPNTVRLANP
jgi:hypothetical protein